LCEVQALTVSSPLPMPRRTTVGFDINRVHLLVAVLDRHAGTGLLTKDIFANVVGGLKLSEPAADLAFAAAIISSLYDLPVPSKSVFFGEVGLTGEVRAVSMIELRVREADKLGFERFFAPYSNKRNLFDLPPALEKKIIWIRNIRDLVGHLKGKNSSVSRNTSVRSEMDL
jgi:DNA repair protein RadA/Sms